MADEDQPSFWQRWFVEPAKSLDRVRKASVKAALAGADDTGTFFNGIPEGFRNWSESKDSIGAKNSAAQESSIKKTRTITKAADDSIKSGDHEEFRTQVIKLLELQVESTQFTRQSLTGFLFRGDRHVYEYLDNTVAKLNETIEQLKAKPDAFKNHTPLEKQELLKKLKKRTYDVVGVNGAAVTVYVQNGTLGTAATAVEGTMVATVGIAVAVLAAPAVAAAGAGASLAVGGGTLGAVTSTVVAGGTTGLFSIGTAAWTDLLRTSFYPGMKAIDGFNNDHWKNVLAGEATAGDWVTLGSSFIPGGGSAGAKGFIGLAAEKAWKKAVIHLTKKGVLVAKDALTAPMKDQFTKTFTEELAKELLGQGDGPPIMPDGTAVPQDVLKELKKLITAKPVTATPSVDVTITADVPSADNPAPITPAPPAAAKPPAAPPVPPVAAKPPAAPATPPVPPIVSPPIPPVASASPSAGAPVVSSPTNNPRSPYDSLELLIKEAKNELKEQNVAYSSLLRDAVAEMRKAGNANTPAGYKKYYEAMERLNALAGINRAVGDVPGKFDEHYRIAAEHFGDRWLSLKYAKPPAPITPAQIEQDCKDVAVHILRMDKARVDEVFAARTAGVEPPTPAVTTAPTPPAPAVTASVPPAAPPAPPLPQESMFSLADAMNNPTGTANKVSEGLIRYKEINRNGRKDKTTFFVAKEEYAKIKDQLKVTPEQWDAPYFRISLDKDRNIYTSDMDASIAVVDVDANGRPTAIIQERSLQEMADEQAAKAAEEEARIKVEQEAVASAPTVTAAPAPEPGRKPVDVAGVFKENDKEGKGEVDGIKAGLVVPIYLGQDCPAEMSLPRSGDQHVRFHDATHASEHGVMYTQTLKEGAIERYRTISTPDEKGRLVLQVRESELEKLEIGTFAKGIWVGVKDEKGNYSTVFSENNPYDKTNPKDVVIAVVDARGNLTGKAIMVSDYLAKKEANEEHNAKLAKPAVTLAPATPAPKRPMIASPAQEVNSPSAAPRIPSASNQDTGKAGKALKDAGITVGTPNTTKPEVTKLKTVLEHVRGLGTVSNAPNVHDHIIGTNDSRGKVKLSPGGRELNLMRYPTGDNVYDGVVVHSDGVQVYGFEKAGLKDNDTLTIQAQGPVHARGHDVVKDVNAGATVKLDTLDKPLVLLFNKKELEGIKLDKTEDGYTRITMSNGAIIESKSDVKIAIAEKVVERGVEKLKITKVDADKVIEAQNAERIERAREALGGTLGISRAASQTNAPQAQIVGAAKRNTGAIAPT